MNKKLKNSNIIQEILREDRNWIEIYIDFYLKIFLWHFEYCLNEIFGKMNNKLQDSNAS